MKPCLANERSRCAPQVRIAGLDLGHPGRPRRCHGSRRSRVADFDVGHQRGHGRTDRGPVRRFVVAGPRQRLAELSEPRLVLELRQAGPPQQRPQRRIAERRLVEFAEMRVAAAVFQEQGIADVVQRRAVFMRGQRPARGGGEVLKTHAISFRRSPFALPVSAGRPPAGCPEPANPWKTT